MMDYDQLCQTLGEIILLAEKDTGYHLKAVEMLMASVGKVCLYTLNDSKYEESTRTKEAIKNLLVELCSAMLRDYLEINSS